MPTNKGQFKKGFKPWNKGKKGWNKGHSVSKKTREKISKTLTGRKRPNVSGKKNCRWKGGISRGYRKGYKHDYKYRLWKSKVFERDNWTCQTCHKTERYLEPHHIKGWAKYPKLRYSVNNGVTLCVDCHRLTDNYRGKK